MKNKLIKRKTVVVLPGGLWQIPIIKKSKSMGYRTLVINPYENSPAFSYADGYLKSDIFDIEQVIQYCKHEKADAVISEECDIAMPLMEFHFQSISCVKHRRRWNSFWKIYRFRLL